MFNDPPAEINNWCAVGPSAHLMIGFYRKLLTAHFGDPRQITALGANRAETLLWKATATPTGLVIESLYRWTPEVTNVRPGILIGRNAFESQRIGIDDAIQGGVVLSGERYYCKLVRGSHTLYCVSGLPAEADIIAAEVYAHVGQFAPRLREELNLARLTAVGVGKLFELKEARGSYAVPVTVAFVGIETWRLVPQTPILQRMTLSELVP